MDYTNDFEWIEKQKQHLFNNSMIEGPHDCWTCKLGGFLQPYSKLCLKFSETGVKKTVRSHRLMYMLFNNRFDIKTKEQVSHLCHNCRCVNPQHLSLEPDHINKDRQICRGVVPLRCRSHHPHPDCLL